MFTKRKNDVNIPVGISAIKLVVVKDITLDSILIIRQLQNILRHQFVQKRNEDYHGILLHFGR